MMVVSMATNCFLIGFSSEQLAVWAPEMYETAADGDQWIKPGYGRYFGILMFTSYDNIDRSTKMLTINLS